MKPIAVTQFKARCLSMLEAVARTGESFVVTKRGKPLARVVPTSGAHGGRAQDSLFGTVESVGEIVSPAATGDVWNAARGVLLTPARRARRRTTRR